MITLELNIFQNILKNSCASVMCGYFFTGFTNFMLKDKSLLDYTNLFSLNECEKNDKIILKYIQ